MDFTIGDLRQKLHKLHRGALIDTAAATMSGRHRLRQGHEFVRVKFDASDRHVVM